MDWVCPRKCRLSRKLFRTQSASVCVGNWGWWKLRGGETEPAPLNSRFNGGVKKLRRYEAAQGCFCFRPLLALLPELLWLCASP